MTEIPRIVQLLDPEGTLIAILSYTFSNYLKDSSCVTFIKIFLIESIQSRTGISRLEDDDNNHYMILP
jgi:hypothetical protein